MSERLLHGAPSEDELARMYWELSALGAPAGGEKRSWAYAPATREELVCLASEMARYDARLLTILVAWLVNAWETLDPLALRRCMATMQSPQALCVVLTFVRDAARDEELRRYAEYVCGGWPKVDPPEHFFFDVERPHTKLAARRFGRSLAQYSRWGFVATERPSIDVFSKRAVGRYEPRTRIELLRRLAQRRGELRLSEYLDEIDHSVTRRQAAIDARNAGLVQRGTKRGARWVWPREGIEVLIRSGDVRVRESAASPVTSLQVASPRAATVIAEPDIGSWIPLKAGRTMLQVRARDLIARDADDAALRSRR